MNIKIIAVGKLKDRFWSEASAEYEKRLSRFCSLDIREIKEAKLPGNASPADEADAMEAEGRDILSKVEKSDYVIALAVEGKELDSPAFASKIRTLADEGKSLAFIIGGSNGLSDEVKARANEKLSFSRMTFPHRMARIILLEQIYRAYKINAGETYHK